MMVFIGIQFLLMIDWRIRMMNIALQLVIFALIAISSILLISVPIVFAFSMAD